MDIAAISLDERCALLGECKWSRKKIGVEVLADLKRKAAQFPRLEGFKTHYALFSRAGFERSLLELAQKEQVLLFEGMNLK